MVDFLFAIIELFSLAVIRLRRYKQIPGIGRSRCFTKGVVTLTANFRGRRRRLPSDVGVRKLVIALVYDIEISSVCSFVSSQSTRETDGRTDRNTIPNMCRFFINSSFVNLLILR